MSDRPPMSQTGIDANRGKYDALPDVRHNSLNRGTVATNAIPMAADWTSRYPPLLTMLVALMLALFVPPSGLPLPQPTPSQTLEYAPFPPSDDANPPAGNVATLGLGSSSSVAGD